MNLYERALIAIGREAQLAQAQEECAELIVAVNHYRRGRDGALDALASEVADVQIMAAQLEVMLGSEIVRHHRDGKLKRLKALVEAAEKAERRRRERRSAPWRPGA